MLFDDDDLELLWCRQLLLIFLTRFVVLVALEGSDFSGKNFGGAASSCQRFFEKTLYTVTPVQKTWLSWFCVEVDQWNDNRESIKSSHTRVALSAFLVLSRDVTQGQRSNPSAILILARFKLPIFMSSALYPLGHTKLCTIAENCCTLWFRMMPAYDSNAIK